MAVRSCRITQDTRARRRKERNARILACESCREANRVGWKRDWKRKSGSEKQLIKPCLIYNSAFGVNSLINNVWVVHATSSLSNTNQAGTDFYKTGTHQPALIASSWVEIEMDGRRSTKKTSPHIKRRQEAGSKLDRHIKTAAGCCFAVIWQTRLLPSSQP